MVNSGVSSLAAAPPRCLPSNRPNIRPPYYSQLTYLLTYCGYIHLPLHTTRYVLLTHYGDTYLPRRASRR